ncbi:MAG: aspartate aminotransferase family protein [bacterium]
MSQPHADLPETERPELRTAVPGPGSLALARRLARVESRGVTCLEPAPIFWQRAAGANVWDVDDNRFVDLTAAFGVANVGHAHPRVAEAVARQAGDLMHGMGDVHPPRVKVELLERLVALYPFGSRGASAADVDADDAAGETEPASPPVSTARAVLSSSGSDAVETALKTALLATGRAGVVAFEGAYHGLSLGALDCTWRTDFREPFRARLPEATRFARYGDLEDVARVAREGDRAGHEPIGAVLVEPIQGRGGERVPPEGFLTGLRRLCDEHGWLLIADEVYTGCGRTGRFFACEHEGVVPDLLCVGKGLASGMPFSACLGRSEVFEAWPTSTGEALHTQTFLGHPVGCAAALASLEISTELDLASRSRALGEAALARLKERLRGCPAVREVRGRGLMIGIECIRPEISLAASGRLLERGYIVLPSGEGGRVLSLTPPLVIGEQALLEACDALAETLLDADTDTDTENAADADSGLGRPAEGAS